VSGTETELAAGTSRVSVGLLERSDQLSALNGALDAVGSGRRGRLALLSGEAGAGKTAVLRCFCDEHRAHARVLWGACDALFTPRPLGPLFDLAEVTGGELKELVAGGAKSHEVVAALVRALARRAPTVVVIEDLHWADEATLDVVRLLGRRVHQAPALVLASYRDDELDRAHPLRVVLGELAADQSIARIPIAPLSSMAVAELAERQGMDGEELYRKTGGNPFFVTEVLAAASDDVPATVRDAVLARTARLSPAGRRLLEAVAMVPPHAELWLLEAIAGESATSLEECLASGMLIDGPAGIAFRHELARLTIEASAAPDRTLALHRRALAALAESPAGAPDPDRLAHHAGAVGDADVVLRYAPEAAARAAAFGAHREATAHYRRALRFADSLSADDRAALLQRHSRECYLTDQVDEAIDAMEGAIELYRGLGDGRQEGVALCGLSQILWCPGRAAAAERAAHESVALLEQVRSGRELGLAYANLSQLRLNAGDTEGALTWGRRAIEIGERLDDSELRVQVLINTGAAEFVAGVPGGREKLERSLELAREAGLEEERGRAYINLVWGATSRRDHATAGRYLQEGLEYATDRGQELWRVYLLAYRTHWHLARGHWDDALCSADLVLRRSFPSTLPRTLALAVVGVVRARRGDPEVWDVLDQALALAEPTGELQRLAPVAAARAEAAWLSGKTEEVAGETDAAFELALMRKAPWPIGELAHWRWRAGLLEDSPPGAAEPYAAQIAGDWARAAERWAELGCPYERALALADSPEETELRRALAELQRLGARPVAALVARRLRQRGARGLPRGPRPATRRNPANLTSRELEVLRLVARGLRNAEVAERLVLAEKTVDHHVSAILRKLGVRTRGEASAEAVRLGLVAQDR
jgi:ATP/maltotriose-dependent transcriptional regulator MalT